MDSLRLVRVLQEHVILLWSLVRVKQFIQVIIRNIIIVIAVYAKIYAEKYTMQ
jgi:hypothetical protein